MEKSGGQKSHATVPLTFISKFFGWVNQNQNSDLAKGFLLGFCIDHKYLNKLDWLYFEENVF